MGEICMTDAGTTQDNFILPAPPVRGLSISQDWLDITPKDIHEDMVVTLGENGPFIQNGEEVEC